jgi:hypothetical protein
MGEHQHGMLGVESSNLSDSTQPIDMMVRLVELKRLVKQSSAMLDCHSRDSSQEYYNELVKLLCELHDEIEDRISSRRNFLSIKYQERPYGRMPFLWGMDR